MGPLEDILSMIPGFSQIKELKTMMPGEKDLKKIECMIQSMTIEERENPKIINGPRKIRISKGSGTDVTDINQLLKQFEQSQKMVKQMSKFSKFGMPGGMNINNFPGMSGLPKF
nr:signal recognition particle protein [Candidatus Dependentiae bacterium]